MTANGEAGSSWIKGALDRYEGPLLRYAQRITGDLEQARDVVQETFLRLCREDPAELDGRLPQWLFTVCRNYSIDVRRKGLRMTPLAEPLVAETPTADRGPVTEVTIRDEAEHIFGMLDSLPENQQEVIRLKFQNGLRYRQIAEITGLTVTNVGFLLHRGLKTLRERLRASNSFV